MTTTPASATRTPEGRFAPGSSGNPAGRPQGARSKTTLAAEALFEEHGEGVLRGLVAKALGGDVRAACFLVDRLVPRAKGEFVELAVDPGKAHDFVHIHGLVLQATCAGEISVEAAAKLSRILATGARLAEQRRRADARLRAAEARTRIQPAAKPATPRAPAAPTPRPQPAPAPAVKPLSDLYFSTALARVEAARSAPLQLPPVFSRAPATLPRAA